MGAVLSDCGKYRYRLDREFGEGPRALYVMLNPSTADAERDDPTIRKCVGFAKRWGCGSVRVVNLFAYRATSPSDMKKFGSPIGPENDQYLLREFEAAKLRGDKIIAAWGTHGKHKNRDRVVKQMLARLGINAECISKSKDGHPCHPLMMAYDTPLEPLAPLHERTADV